MQNIEGLYTALNALITQRESENRAAISVDDMIEAVKKEVDVYSASLDWYIRFALRAAADSALYQRGYRSVVHGEGLFVNYENCIKPQYLARLFNNAKLSEEQKRRATERIRTAIKNSGVDGQMTIDFETGEIVEDITEEQLILMLLADAAE